MATDEKLKFNLTGPEAAARRKTTRIQILQGDAECFMSKNPTLLPGEWAYERDTGKIKIGDGRTPWRELPYKIDQTLTEDMVTTINQAGDLIINKDQPGGYASLGPDGKISKRLLPDEFKSTTVVRTISDMEQIPDKYPGLFTFVLDASEDDTVGSGAATYIWTGDKWEKVSEAESMDIDSSDFLLKSKDTLDNILAGDKYVHFSKEDKAKLDSIEKDATGDLSAQEIATMYESLKDVNRLTDELNKKLVEIEKGATKDTSETIREKLQNLTSSERLNADYIQPGAKNQFFTDKERKEIDSIVTKLKTVEEGATKDSPEQVRDKLQSLNMDKLISADYIKDGATNKFLTPSHLKSIKLIGTISDELNKLKGQVGNVDEKRIKNIADTQIKEISSQLESLTTDVNSDISRKLNDIQVDLGSNQTDMENFGDMITSIQSQLGNLSESWIKDHCDTKVRDLLSTLEKFRSEINNTCNQRYNTLQGDIGANKISIDNLNGLNTALSQKMNKVENELGSTVFDIAKLGDSNTALHQKLNKVENDLGAAGTTIANLADINSALNQKLNKVENDFSSSTFDIDKLSDSNNVLNQRLNKFENDLGNTGTTISNLTDFNNVLNQKLNRVENELGSAVFDIDKLSDSNSVLNQKLNKFEGDLGSTVFSIDKLNDANNVLNQKLIKIESNLGADSTNISNLNDAITRLQNQVNGINESWVRNIYDSKIQDIIKRLDGFKSDINNSIDKKLNQVTVDIGSNSVNLSNLGDTISRIQNQLSNINESWVKNITEKSIQDLAGDINNFKTEITNSFNDRMSNFEVSLGDLALNLRNEFISNINERLNSEIGRLEGVLNGQIENFQKSLTPDQIKVLYESNPDTNVFTDSEKAKLAGIMPGADVTNHDTVKAAGAVMEGDIIFGGDCAVMF